MERECAFQEIIMESECAFQEQIPQLEEVVNVYSYMYMHSQHQHALIRHSVAL